MPKIRIEKRDHAGRLVWAYDSDEVERTDHYVLISAHFDRADRDDGYFVWQQGDRFLEWHYADRWYNVFKIFDRDTGAVRGWYCNITRPAVIGAGVVSADDLELDVFVFPDGRMLRKDEDEFHALDLPAADRAQAEAAAAEIERLAAAKIAPFD
ncbi:MAG: DUF402 domain-containing protein [Chloroflexi bacterium]|nr:DUF402 domain-containing protein [Chloroflexota bacterium]